MGIWRSERGRVSDGMTNILAKGFQQIGQLDNQFFTIIDLADAIEFATGGFLTVEINPRLQEAFDYSIVGKLKTKLPKNAIVHRSLPLASLPVSDIQVSKMGAVDLGEKQFAIPNRGQVVRAKERIESNYQRALMEICLSVGLVNASTLMDVDEYKDESRSTRGKYELRSTKDELKNYS